MALLLRGLFRRKAKTTITWIFFLNVWQKNLFMVRLSIFRLLMEPCVLMNGNNASVRKFCNVYRDIAVRSFVSYLSKLSFSASVEIITSELAGCPDFLCIYQFMVVDPKSLPALILCWRILIVLFYFDPSSMCLVNRSLDHWIFLLYFLWSGDLIFSQTSLIYCWSSWDRRRVIVDSIPLDAGRRGTGKGFPVQINNLITVNLWQRHVLTWNERRIDVFVSLTEYPP